MKKVLHADMQLSTRSNDCWSAHYLSAMDGLTQLHIFKQKKLQNCEPFDLSHFIARRPQGETLGVLDTLFWNSSERRTQQQTLLYLSPMMCSSYKRGSSHSFALHPKHVSQPAS